MNCNHWWQRPVLLAGLLVCGASLGVHQTQAAPSANLDQTRNGKFDAPTGGITVGTDDNGNAGFQNSHYLEGHGIPYRCLMSDLPTGIPITITLGFDIKHSGKNALDYLTGYQLLDPHTQFRHLAEVVDPAVGTSFQGTSPTSDLLIDTPTASSPTFPPATSFNNLLTQTIRPGFEKKMSLWGGTLNSIKYVDTTASWDSKLSLAQAQIQIKVTFTASSRVAVLAWAGHIASRVDWGFDANGVPNSAGGIDGSPYHMALIGWTLSNLGQQDRSLKANAVITPPTCSVTGDSACVGEAAALTVTAITQVGGFGGPYTFQWSRDPNFSTGTIISTAETLSFTQVKLSDDGTYYAKVIDKAGISSLGCNGKLNVNSPPTVSVNSPSTCDGTAVEVKATITPPNGATVAKCEWTVPQDFPNPGDVVRFPTKVAGDYSVEVTDSNGCKAKYTGTVTVNALPKVDVNSPLTCDGKAVEVKATITLQPGAKVAKCKWICPDGASEPVGDDVSSFYTKVAGKYTVYVTDSNGCEQSGYGIVDVISPAIACGDGVNACGAPVVILHPLDADAFGGAAIVNDAAVPLDTFPSGTDISYESFDQFAVLSLGPNQETTGKAQVPVCNTGDVDLVGVTVTFYKGTDSEQILPNATPTDCIVVETGLPFDGKLAAHQKLTLKGTVRVQCGTVPIIVSGQTNDKEPCYAASSCSTVVPCVEVFCRTTGGGRQDPGPTTLLQVNSGNALVTDTSVKFTTHGGKLRGRQTCSVLGSPDICGQWQHVRHASNGRLQSFHTAGIFDSLRCACLACGSLEPLPDGTVCNPGDRVCGPEPRRANANAIAVTGLGYMALTPGKKDTLVAFRIYIEDRGEPGGSPFGHPEDPPDVYCIQIWKNPTDALRASISCLLGRDLPAGIPVPDISDCGDLSRGNHQLHPVKNLNCP
jgi:hypothetical protein